MAIHLWFFHASCDPCRTHVAIVTMHVPFLSTRELVSLVRLCHPPVFMGASASLGPSQRHRSSSLPRHSGAFSRAAPVHSCTSCLAWVLLRCTLALPFSPSLGWVAKVWLLLDGCHGCVLVPVLPPLHVHVLAKSLWKTFKIASAVPRDA